MQIWSSLPFPLTYVADLTTIYIIKKQSSEGCSVNNLLTLNNGSQIPSLGLGMWKIDKPILPELVQEAIKIGYRHFDSACDYGNETQVGKGIQSAIKSGFCNREDLWITSKLWNTYHAAEHVRPALQKSLNDLKLDYLDLYLIHFPIATKFVPFEHRYPPEWFYDPDAEFPKIEIDPVPIRETWEAMEDLVSQGLVKNIGICNFNCSLIRDLLSYAKIRPSVLQVELHPRLTQEKLLKYCHQEKITVTGFSPLGAESYYSIGMALPEQSLLANAVIAQISNAHKKTPAQIILRWGVQRGTAIVPKTSSPERLRENYGIFEFHLDEDEMTAITALNLNQRYNDPGHFCDIAFNTFFPIYE
jgi:D-xylose reductase